MMAIQLPINYRNLEVINILWFIRWNKHVNKLCKILMKLQIVKSFKYQKILDY